jgi:hypothetical protein
MNLKGLIAILFASGLLAAALPLIAADAGGTTIYDGQLATELIVHHSGAPPLLEITRTNNLIRVSWPAAAGCFRLEATESGGASSVWQVVEAPRVIMDGRVTVERPTPSSQEWFRLRKD